MAVRGIENVSELAYQLQDSISSLAETEAVWGIRELHDII